jgi:Laminin B (Domain IV)/FlgD Ig-like domain
MNRTLLLVTCFLVSAFLPSFSDAQIAESTFATGDDGWLSVTLPYPSAIPPTIVASFTPVWHADLGGYISMVDPDGTTTGNTEYWQAPAAFLGSKGSAYGGALSFDLANAPGSGLFAQEDIILLGGGLTLVYNLGSAPGGAFVHYSVPMTEAGWTRDSAMGPAATQTEFLTALASLTDIFIRAEFQLGTDTEYLDNVVMSAPVTGVDRVVAPSFVLEQNIPNPFNPSTQISFSLEHDSIVRVDVFDAGGNRVRTLWSGPASRGGHTIAWDGRDSRGRSAASGVYFCRASSGSTSRIIKMILLK